jgi:hypothetical protein
VGAGSVAPGSWASVGSFREFDVDGCVCCLPGALVTDDGVEGDDVAVSEKCRMPEREQFQSSCHYLFKRGCLVVEGTNEIPQVCCRCSRGRHHRPRSICMFLIHSIQLRASEYKR